MGCPHRLPRLSPWDGRCAPTGVVLVGRKGGLADEVSAGIRSTAPIIAELERPTRPFVPGSATPGSGSLAGSVVVVLTEPSLPAIATTRLHRHRLRALTAGYTSLVSGARDLGAERLVVCSSAFLYPDDGGQPLHPSTSSELRAETVAPHAAEQAARFFTALGGRSVVLRLGWVFGEHDPIAGRVVAAARKGWQLIDGRPGAWVASIASVDAAAAIRIAMTAPPGTYNISDGRPVTQAAINAVLQKATGSTLHPLFDARWGESGVLFGSSRLLADTGFSDVTGWRPTSSDLRRFLFDAVRRPRRADADLPGTAADQRARDGRGG